LVARWLRDRFEGDERFWVRTTERAGRQASLSDVEHEVSIEMEVWA
jgi:hypothetical protein